MLTLLEASTEPKCVIQKKELIYSQEKAFMHGVVPSSRTLPEWLTYWLPLPLASHALADCPPTRQLSCCGLAILSGPSQHGEEHCDQQTYNTRLGSFRPLCWQGSKLLFWGSWGVTIGFLFLDGHKKEAGWPLSPVQDKDSGSLPSAFSCPTKGLSPASSPSPYDSAPSFVNWGWSDLFKSCEACLRRPLKMQLV